MQPRGREGGVTEWAGSKGVHDSPSSQIDLEGVHDVDEGLESSDEDDSARRARR